MSAFPVVERTRVEGGFRLRVHVPEDSPYFDGHFPGEPVLPAVAQLALVQQLASACVDGTAVLVAAPALRFRGRIRPGDTVDVRLFEPGPGAEWRFEIEGADAPISAGRVVLS